MLKMRALKRMTPYLGRFTRGAPGRVLWAGLLLLLVCGCGWEPQATKRKAAPRLKGALAEYRDGTITVDECAKWFTLYGNRSLVPLEGSNETQWVQEAANSRALESSLSEQARQLGLDERPQMLERRDLYTDDALIRLYFLEKVLTPIEITRQEIERYYQEHQIDFHRPERFSLRMIFFDPEKEGREKARQRALEAMDRIRKGAEFDALIAEYSDIDEPDRTKEFGPYQPEEGLLAAIEAAALSLPVGEVSDIIEHDKGFHIIKLTQRTEAHDPPLDEVKDEIHERLLERKIQLAEEQIEQSQGETLKIQRNYHILGLPITATNDVVLRIAEEVMTYGDYLDMLRQGNYASEEEFARDFQRRYREMLYLALARREGYAERPEVQERVGLQMDRELTFALLEEQIDSEIQVTEEEIRKEFDEHRALFHDPKMVYARQIYLPIPYRPDMPRYELIREIQNTKARAYQILMKLLEGLRFEEAARLYSSAPDADSGGLIGWVPFGYSRRFDEAAFKLDEGEITLEPVARRRGFQLIKVEKTQKLRLKTLEEARDQIYDRLFRLKSDEARNAFVANEIERLQVEIDSTKAEQFGAYLRHFWEQDSIYTVFD